MHMQCMGENAQQSTAGSTNMAFPGVSSHVCPAANAGQAKAWRWNCAGAAETRLVEEGSSNKKSFPMVFAELESKAR